MKSMKYLQEISKKLRNNAPDLCFKKEYMSHTAKEAEKLKI